MIFSSKWLRRLLASLAAAGMLSLAVPAQSESKPRPAPPPEQSVYSGGLELRVHLHEVSEDRREPLAKAVKEAADNVQAYLRSGLEGALDIELVGSEDAFSEVMAKHAVTGWDERWLAGLAMLNERRIIVHVNGTRALTTRETLEHELVHLGLHTASGGRFLPAWYQEGVATLLAGEATFERLRDLAGAAPLGQLESLANLNEGFHGSQVARQRAYATAAGFLQFATRRAGGISAIGDVQRRLQEGAALDRAFAMTFGAPPADLYAVYATQIQASASAWAVLLSDNAIWSAISLLGMFAMLQAYRNRPRPEALATGSQDDDEPIDLEAIAAAGQQALRRPWHATQFTGLQDPGGPLQALQQRADDAVLAAIDSHAQPGEDDQWQENSAPPEGFSELEEPDPDFGLASDRPVRPWHLRDFANEPLQVPGQEIAEVATDAEGPEPAEPAEITSDTAEPWSRTLH